MTRILIANPACRLPLNEGDERYFFGAGCRFPWSLRKHPAEHPRFAMFPFFLGYAAALLERDGFSVKAIDGVPLNLSHDDFIQHALSTQPEVILFEPATPTINWISEVARSLAAQTSAKIVMAGPHVTTFAHDFLREHPHVNYVLIGEYEMTFLELARRLRKGDTSVDIPGVAFRTAEGQIRGGQRAPEIDPLDQLPPPARHLFPAFFNNDLGLYHDGFCQYRPAIQLHSSRGCPFHCNFCLWVQTLYANGKHRCFSPGRIVDEMIEARDRHHAREIYFDDDDFTVRKEHVLRLCDEIERRHVRIPWSVMGDLMASDEETLARMARAGCIGLKFGLESADPLVLQRTGKPINTERILRLVAAARSLGLKTHMTVTFGLPGETPASLAKTFDFACRLDIDSVQFSVATPYPGTRFYAELQQAGCLRAQAWEDFDGANNVVFESEEIDRQFLESFQASAHGRWLRYKLHQPRWLYRQAGQLLRLARGQGIFGLYRRLLRGYHLLKESVAPLPSAPAASSRGISSSRVTGPRR